MTKPLKFSLYLVVRESHPKCRQGLPPSHWRSSRITLCFSHTPQAFAHLTKASNALPAFPHHYYSSFLLDLGSSAPGSLSLRDAGALWVPLALPFSHVIRLGTQQLYLSHPCTPAPTTKPVQKGTHVYIELKKKKKDRREALVLKEKAQGRLVFANYPFSIDYSLRYLFLPLHICWI